MKILILKEKNEDRYFDVSDNKKMYETCRYILKERLAAGYWYEMEEPKNRTGFKTKEEIDLLPEGAVKSSAIYAWNYYKWNYYESDRRAYEHSKQFVEKATKAVKISFEDYKPSNPNERMSLLHSLLALRQDHEYEEYYLVETEEI